MNYDPENEEQLRRLADEIEAEMNKTLASKNVLSPTSVLTKGTHKQCKTEMSQLPQLIQLPMRMEVSPPSVDFRVLCKLIREARTAVDPWQLGAERF